MEMLELRMVRHRDGNALMRGILLLALTALLARLIVTGEIGNYIHPRFTWFTGSAGLGFVLMAVAQFRRALRGITGSIPELRTGFYAAVTAMVCVGFLIRPHIFGADLAAKQGINLTTRSTGSSIAGRSVSPASPVEQPATADPAPSAPSNTPDHKDNSGSGGSPVGAAVGAAAGATPSITPPVEQVPPSLNMYGNEPPKLEGDTIVITAQNFAPWMVELYENPTKYFGKNLSMDGFVFTPENVAADQFTVVRLVVTCHVAHAFPDGLLTSPMSGGQKPQENSWFRAEGVLGPITLSGQQTIRLTLTSLTSIAQPADPYIYP